MAKKGKKGRGKARASKNNNNKNDKKTGDTPKSKSKSENNIANEDLLPSIDDIIAELDQVGGKEGNEGSNEQLDNANTNGRKNDDVRAEKRSDEDPDDDWDDTIGKEAFFGLKTSKEDLRRMIPLAELEEATKDLFIDPNNFTGKWIATKMPTSAQCLERGTLCRKEFFMVFKEHFDDKISEWARSMSERIEKGHENDPWDCFTVLVQDSFEIAEAANPTRFAANPARDGRIDDFLELILKFSVEVYRRVRGMETVSLLNGGDGLGGEDTGQIFTLATDSACETLASEIDKLCFRGRKLFLRICPLYGAKRKDAVIKVIADSNRLLLKSQRLVWFRQFQAAVDEVADGKRRDHKTCWQCSSRVSTLFECASCKVAQYCGKKCQKKAWKSGHKSACEDLGRKYEIFAANLTLIEAQHDREIERGIVPAFEIDFDLCSRCTNTFAGHIWKGSGLEGELSGPSMDYFFQNISHVRDGRFWFFRSTLGFEGDDKQGFRFYEKILLVFLVKLLCYDYSGYLEKKGMPDSEFCNVFFVKNCINFQRDKDVADSSGMSAQRFLELYDMARTFQGTEEEQADLRQNLRDNARKKFLKHSRCGDDNRDESSRGKLHQQCGHEMPS